MRLIISVLCIICSMSHLGAREPENPQWRLEAKSRPVWVKAKSLFDEEIRLTPAQEKLLARMDATTLRGLEINNLRVPEIVSAIRACLRDAEITDIVIRTDFGSHAFGGQITFAQRDLRLSNALKYLLELGGVAYTLRGNEIVVTPRETGVVSK